MDILGGLVGCLICAVLFVFVAPVLYISSPSRSIPISESNPSLKNN